MNKKLNIVVIEGTIREERNSIQAAKYIYNLLKNNEEVEAVFVDPRDFNMPNDGNDDSVRDPKYTEITKNADGFFIIVPEYNHSFPGSLKRLLDSELKNYNHKPVGFAGVSSGPWGGVRAVESLVNVARKLGLVATFTDVYFPRVQEMFNEDGSAKDNMTKEIVEQSIKELVWMAKVLKYGREQIK